jgi:hypothetical protein
MDEQSTRKAALLKPGTLSPNPWDLTPSGQNGWRYNEGTRTEDKAPQGCDLSAASSAGMAGAAAMLRPPQNIQIQTRQRLTYCRPNLVLTMGSTLGVVALGRSATRNGQYRVVCLVDRKHGVLKKYWSATHYGTGDDADKKPAFSEF